jgi:hypothetical protein
VWRQVAVACASVMLSSATCPLYRDIPTCQVLRVRRLRCRRPLRGSMLHFRRSCRLGRSAAAAL